MPEAADAIHYEIGRRFTDSVAARGGSRYRIRITSVTRTPETVRRRLRRRNVNAADLSVSQLTTVDVSYASLLLMPANPVARSVDDLKGCLPYACSHARRGKRYM